MKGPLARSIAVSDRADLLAAIKAKAGPAFRAAYDLSDLGI
jgi:hypothetical protein